MYDKVIQNHKNDTIAEKYKYIYIYEIYLYENYYKTLPKAKRTRGSSSYHKITAHNYTYYNFRIFALRELHSHTLYGAEQFYLSKL